jgi:type IX secretion system PorP/SprF family membrane protein
MKIKLLLPLFVITALQLYGQQFTPLSQYMLNSAYLNPAYTGEGEQYSITALHRAQWARYRDYTGDAVAPQLQLFTGLFSIGSTGHSVGLLFSRDKAAYLTSAMAEASYAYRIRLTEVSSLSIGVQGGIESRSIDFDKYILEHEDDPLIGQGKQNETRPDATVGLWYDHERYYAGFSLKSFTAKNSFTTPGFQSAESYVFTAGYHAFLSKELKLTPSVQTISSGSSLALDVSMLANYSDALWGGISYRHEQAVALLAGVGFLEKKLKVGYSFDYVTNNRTVTANTSHEIMVSSRAGKVLQKKMKFKLKKSTTRKPMKPLIKINDRDRDGVPDEKDNCIDEPGFKKLGGCPDKDADGVPDNTDQCPAEPGSKALHGCPDTDKDGIPDLEDKCPDQAGSKDLKGCPDTDQDGVPDHDDGCPDIPGTSSDGGCPVSLTHEKLANITFTTGKATLEESSYQYLDDAVEVLKKYDNTLVLIEGHTDSEGDERFNEDLSVKRAEVIREYFIEKGIQADRLSVVGYGETKPVDTNDTEEGKFKNRRVEIRFIRGTQNEK